LTIHFAVVRSLQESIPVVETSASDSNDDYQYYDE
jgi:hypothetical protein